MTMRTSSKTPTVQLEQGRKIRAYFTYIELRIYGILIVVSYINTAGTNVHFVRA